MYIYNMYVSIYHKLPQNHPLRRRPHLSRLLFLLSSTSADSSSCETETSSLIQRLTKQQVRWLRTGRCHHGRGRLAGKFDHVHGKITFSMEKS